METRNVVNRRWLSSVLLVISSQFFTTLASTVLIPETRLTASDAVRYDYFGWAVAIDRDTLVVGTPADSLDSRPSGGAYIFARSGTGWTEQAQLTVEPSWLDRCGAAVAISGDTVVVGAPSDTGSQTVGAAYVFVRDGAAWNLQAKLAGTEAAENDLFGQSVAISGETIVVASPENYDPFTRPGSAYVFVRDGTNWSQAARLLAGDGAGADEFGTAVAIDGDTIVVGARGDDDGGLSSGSAYVFARNGTNWVEQQKLTANDAAQPDAFGSAVAISGERIVVGAPEHPAQGSWSGAIYVFVRNTTVWNLQQELQADDAAAGDQFGCAVGIRGDTVVAGANAKGDQGTSSGAAYLFSYDGTHWTQLQKLTADDPAAGDNFGWSVAIGDAALAFGAPLKDTAAGPDAGAAYLFVTGTEPRPTGGLPAPWQNQDLGAAGVAGSADFSDGTFTVSGSGADIWGDSDAFHFVYRKWANDGIIVARVTSVENNDPWAKAGVMFRQSLDPASPNAFIMLTPQNGSGFQSRASMGGDSTYTPTAPHWLKLVRSGNAFTGYTSDDGVGWSLAGSQSIPMSGSIVIGLAVTSRNNSALNTATFTGVLVDAPLLLMHSTGEGSPDQGENK